MITETRTDCTRDNRKVYLPHASSLGYDLKWSKRGRWIQTNQDGNCQIARVVGRVVCERVEYVEAIAVLGLLNIPAIRWYLPHHIMQCSDGIPNSVVQFMFTEKWKDPEYILKRCMRGHLHEPVFATEQGL
jgi:hypothetical protein